MTSPPPLPRNSSLVSDCLINWYFTAWWAGKGVEAKIMAGIGSEEAKHTHGRFMHREFHSWLSLKINQNEMTKLWWPIRDLRRTRALVPEWNIYLMRLKWQQMISAFYPDSEASKCRGQQGKAYNMKCKCSGFQRAGHLDTDSCSALICADTLDVLAITISTATAPWC